MTPLTRDELTVISHARFVERLPDDGSRHQYVRDRLGLPYTTYLQRLNRLLDSPAAYAEAPQLIARLRRIRDARAERRGHVLAP